MTRVVVSELRRILSVAKPDHGKLIMRSRSLKDAHVYCVINQLSGQTYGLLLEKFIGERFGYVSNRANERSGDISRSGVNYEIKVSLGGRKFNKFNYVQIRPNHICSTYILTAYHLSSHNLDDQGELYIFRLSKDEICDIVSKYGCYAHGTGKQNGEISSPLNENMEYALRPSYGSRCWADLMRYRITENDL